MSIQINRLRLRYALAQLSGLWQRIPTPGHKRAAIIRRRLGLVQR